jgi:hypothetical protein
MMSGRVEQWAPSFRVRPEHAPRSKPETYKRLHYYVAKMGVTVSDQLQAVLIDIRRNAYSLPPDIQRTALKGFSDDEFVSTVKEILCIWMHLEAVDQGGEFMPAWLLTFLRLGFGATDYMIPKPKAIDVMLSYDDCDEYLALVRQVAYKIAHMLGFGAHARIFADPLAQILTETGPLRQQILEKALTLPIETILQQALR